jgi:hypothetical protein
VGFGWRGILGKRIGESSCSPLTACRACSILLRDLCSILKTRTLNQWEHLVRLAAATVIRHASLEIARYRRPHVCRVPDDLPRPKWTR